MLSLSVFCFVYYYLLLKEQFLWNATVYKTLYNMLEPMLVATYYIISETKLKYENSLQLYSRSLGGYVFIRSGFIRVI